MELICIKDDGYAPEHLRWIKNFPLKDNLYTVRKRVHTVRGLGYLLEEIHNPLMPNGQEPSFHNSRFRPADCLDNILNSVLEEINLEMSE